MMNFRQPDRLIFWRTLLAISALLTIPAVSQILEVTREQRASNVAASNWSPLIGLALILGMAALVLFILLLDKPPRPHPGPPGFCPVRAGMAGRHLLPDC